MAIRSRAARQRPRPRPASDSAIEPPTSRSLFAYGSLADDRKVASLLERPIASAAAELLDFERVEPVDYPYPLVVEAPGERVSGRLYRHLDDEDFARLDAYQGADEDLYFRDLAGVVRPGGEATAAEAAWVYLPTERTVNRLGRGRS